MLTKFKLINENGFSKIWQHLHSKITFAIIGSIDKDTGVDRSNELITEVGKLSSSVGYRYLYGTYTYKDGETTSELSVIIYNISKDKALEIMRKLNQESIIWKDENFFGFIDEHGNSDGEFSQDDSNMNFSDEDIKQYGSRLVKHKNKNQLKPFKFVLKQDESLEKPISSIRRMGNITRNKEILLELDLIQWENE